MHESLKHDRLYQRKIADAAKVAENVAAYLVLCNEIRPHRSIGIAPPLTALLAAPHLFPR